MLSPIFSQPLNKSNTIEIDLSTSSPLLKGLNFNLNGLEDEISAFIDANNVEFAIGGYLEKRNLYKRFNQFNEDNRDNHLGIDIWSKKQEKLYAPIDAEVVVSFWHEIPGDYGGVIILKHLHENMTVHSLYGHLDNHSIKENPLGKKIKQGEIFARLGEFNENGNWPIHLHFQLIFKEEISGNNFPGVCSDDEIEKYKNLCPNPIEWLIHS
ncbi:MAG: peptidoglycan DD-metalloendopeptidase family protein [Crocinitomicaceae bacterium]|nr:peptidoglycan DD-metalloendopeptidase family protein [Crocinitomicaceae bacterium]